MCFWLSSMADKAPKLFYLFLLYFICPWKVVIDLTVPNVFLTFPVLLSLLLLLGCGERGVAGDTQQHHVRPSSDGPLGSGPWVWGVWHHVSSGGSAVCRHLQGDHWPQDQRGCSWVRESCDTYNKCNKSRHWPLTPIYSHIFLYSPTSTWEILLYASFPLLRS